MLIYLSHINHFLSITKFYCSDVAAKVPVVPSPIQIICGAPFENHLEESLGTEKHNVLVVSDRDGPR